jgi:hypothetical protein
MGLVSFMADYIQLYGGLYLLICGVFNCLKWQNRVQFRMDLSAHSDN